MPMSFAEAMKRDIDKLGFSINQSKKATNKKPKKQKTPNVDDILKSKTPESIIRYAAINLFQILITYKKDTTGEIKKYRVAPYSYRIRKSNNRMKRMLFAYDMDDKHIKGFVKNNIKNVKVLDNRFKPKWPVEIA